MKNQCFNTRRWATRIGLTAACVALPLTAAFAVPSMDGVKDAEYASVATAPADKLVNDPLAVPTPINDTTDPRAKTLVATGISATNSGTDLYVYIDMPNLDLNVIEGEWALVMHLQGANDALQYLGIPADPYGAKCNYMETPAVNVVLKSNMAGFKHDYDGNQGYAFLNPISSGANGWDWESGNFLGNASWTYDTTNNLVHGVGVDGGEIVYKGGKGIEVKIPLRLFAVNPANTGLVNPKPGEGILMQFYDNMRDRTSPNYPRGPVYSVPYEAAAQGDASTHDYASGSIYTWAPAYTLKTPVSLEVGSFTLTDLTDTTHASVGFSAAVGAGATTTANYAVIDKSTGGTIAVTSAAIDPTDNTKVILGLALPFNTTIKVTVTNVQSAIGNVVSATANTAELIVGTPVQFNLYDPHGVIAAVGATSKITMTGDPIGWRNSPGGGNEFQVTPVSGETGHLRTSTIIIKAGAMGYKYRLADVPDASPWDDWNSLNPNDRKFVVPASPTLVQMTDRAAGAYLGTQYDGGTVHWTFTLVDKDNLAAGRAVYVTGTWNGWSADPAVAVPVPAVAGQPNTYRVTFDSPTGNGADVEQKYKYLLIYPDPANPANTVVEWNLLNPSGDHWFNGSGLGTPAAHSVTDLLSSLPDVSGVKRAARILQVVAGLAGAAEYSDYFVNLDADMNGKVTVADAIKAIKG